MVAALIILALIGGAAVVICLVAARKPDRFSIVRRTSIAAPPERIFPLIEDLRAHQGWSPFDQDRSLRRTHSGAPRGKGAVYEWEGSRKAGSGRLAIVESAPPSWVRMRLEMFRPFKADNTVEFTLEQNGAGTLTTWAMQGRQPFMAKLMSTFIDCDKMVGGQFEQGLAKLKTLAEG
jgi:uncharacterized protein YndB with AHSA1/START domain